MAFGIMSSSHTFYDNLPNEIRLLVVAGGGGGGDRYANPNTQSFQSNGGGGAAGGVLDTTAIIDNVTSLTITVGAGGAGSVRDSGVVGGTGGTSSVVSNDGTTVNLTRAGGGAGGGAGPNWNDTTYIMSPSAPGGGGGATRSNWGWSATKAAGAVGNGVTLAGGYGRATGTGSGGGGGNGTTGYNANDGTYPRKGGLGVQSDITGSLLWYGGGGSGGRHFSNANTGTFPREGGGGNGGEQRFYSGGSFTGVTSGTDGTGGGGGGVGGDARLSGETHNGGDGVVIMKILTEDYSGTTTGSPTVTTVGLHTVVKWTSSGSYTV